MQNKMKVMFKAAYIQLRVYMFWIIIATVVNAMSIFVEYLFLGYQADNFDVSVGNLLAIILIFAAIIFPLRFFRRMMNLGATREEYYIGVVAIYVVGSAFFSALSVISLKILDQGLLRDVTNYFDLFELFHWDQFGIVGMFLYQFVVFLLLVSFIHMMFSAVRSPIGLSLWVIVAAAISISTSIAAYRAKLVDGFQVLLFNDSLIAGFGICLMLSCVCLIGGWLFTRRRTF